MRGDTGNEEWLVVLAVGTTTPFDSTQPLVQGIGTHTFTLVDVTVADINNLDRGDRLYIGPGVWDRVVGIERQLTYQQLTPAVQAVLAPTIAGIIQRNERRFIECFNTTLFDDHAGHPLELLPGLGPECRDAIITARSQRRFADFDDLTTRVECINQPQSLLVERVLLELRKESEVYHWLAE